MPDDVIIRRSRGLHRILMLAAGTAWSCGLLASPAGAASTGLPPLVVPATAERHPGKMVLAELVTPDLAGAERFYGGLFGWTFQGVPSGTFAQGSLNGQVVAAIAQRPLPPDRQPGWLGFIATDDVEKTDALAVQNGAKVLFGPHAFANLGREAVLADPQGAVFAVLASSSGDPPDVLADPGAWIWSSLITQTPSVDAGFYKTVFGYESFTMPEAQDAQHLILASGNYARASVNPIPSSWTAGRARWLNYVRVDDATATAAKVTALGGHVLVAPRIDRQGGKVAVVTDPQGALFGLLEWSESDAAPAGAAK